MNDQVNFKSEEQLAFDEQQRVINAALVKGQINELLELLNPGGDQLLTEVTVVTADGPKAFNVAPLFTALAAQFQTLLGHTVDHLQIRMSPLATFFPDAVSEKEGEELVKRHYYFDCIHRHVKMVLTFATPKDGKTVGQPRYETEYTFTGDPHTGDTENYTWRAVVNWAIAQFDQGQYVHLYNHNFEYIWDKEENCNTLVPEKSVTPQPELA